MNFKPLNFKAVTVVALSLLLIIVAVLVSAPERKEGIDRAKISEIAQPDNEQVAESDDVGVSSFTSRELGLSFFSPNYWGIVSHEVYPAGPQSEEEYATITILDSVRPNFSQLVTHTNKLNFSAMTCGDYPCVDIDVYKYTLEAPYILLGMDGNEVADFRTFAENSKQSSNVKNNSQDWYCTQSLGPQSWTLHQYCETYQNNAQYRFNLWYSPNFPITESIPEVAMGELTIEEFEYYARKYPDLGKVHQEFMQLLQSVIFLP